MRRYPFSIIAIALAIISLVACLFVDRQPLSPPIAHAEWAKLVSITGGSPAKRLSESMATAGYTGSSFLDEITICVLQTNVNTARIGGDSNANASTGFPLAPGACITYRAGARSVDVSRIWIFENSTESVAVALRER